MIFAVGTIAFWLLSLIGLVVVLVLFANDMTFTTLACMGIYLGIIDRWGGVEVWHTLNRDPLFWAVIVFGYLVVGLLWATLKWFLLCLKYKVKLDDLLRTFLRNRGLDLGVKWSSFDADMRSEFDRYVHQRDISRTPPRFLDHSNEFAHWMLLWPMSLLCTFVGDFFVDFIDFVVGLCGRTMQRIADGMWSDFTESKS